MMLDNIGLFRGIMAKMNWLDQNQRVIAENVANSDTPGFHPKSLKQQDFESMLGASMNAGGNASSMSRLKMAATDGGHFGAANAPSMNGPAKLIKSKIAYEASPDENGVVLEEQLFKANENQTNYQLATNLYRRNVGMLRMVVQGVGR